MTHTHSQLALRYERATGRIAERQQRILAALRDGGAMTDRQIMERLGLPEPNSVRPRVNELLADGKVAECGSTICGVTGHRVRVVRIQEQA